MLITDVCKGYTEYYSWDLMQSWLFSSKSKGLF